MDQLIALLIAALIFAVGSYGAYLVLVHFKAPNLAYWIVGAILLIVILIFLSRFL